MGVAIKNSLKISTQGSSRLLLYIHDDLWWWSHIIPLSTQFMLANVLGWSHCIISSQGISCNFLLKSHVLYHERPGLLLCPFCYSLWSNTAFLVLFLSLLRSASAKEETLFLEILHGLVHLLLIEAYENRYLLNLYNCKWTHILQ